MHRTSQESGEARVTVVSAGETGDRIAAWIGERFVSVPCLPDGAPLRAVSTAMAAAGAVVIVSGLENDAASRRAAEVAARARRLDASLLTVALVPKSCRTLYGPALRRFKELQSAVDTLLLVGRDGSVAGDGDPRVAVAAAADDEQLVCRCAADMLCVLLGQGTFRVDYAGVKGVLRAGGSFACLGIGIAGGEHAAVDAATEALRDLGRQRVKPGRSGAFLVSVAGSSTMTVADFEEVSTVIHGVIDAGADIIMEALIDEELAGTVRLMVMAKPDARMYAGIKPPRRPS